MADLVKTTTTVVAGKTYNELEQITANNVHKSEISAAAAKIGTLTTRTDNTNGTLTMNAGHGIATGNLIDIYWTGGRRRGVVAGTVATNSVPISGGSGDNLPIATTPVTVMVQNVELVNIVGANCVGITFNNGSPNTYAILQLTQANDTEIAAYPVAPGGAVTWTPGANPTNPVTGQTVGKVKLTHGDSSGAFTLRAQLLYN